MAKGLQVRKVTSPPVKEHPPPPNSTDPTSKLIMYTLLQHILCRMSFACMNFDSTKLCTIT